MGKFGKALGIWTLNIGDVEFELKPKLGDNRRFRNIIMNDKLQKDKSSMFDKFDEFMVGLIHRDEPVEPMEEIKKYVEDHSMQLFEECMIEWNWTTKEQLEKSKKQDLDDLMKKKKTSVN